MPDLRIIVSGGGTGGHIFPAIAIADSIKSEYPDASILFVGANGKMEMEKVPAAGYEIKGLNVVGLQRRLTLKNLAFPFKILLISIIIFSAANKDNFFETSKALSIGFNLIL